MAKTITLTLTQAKQIIKHNNCSGRLASIVLCETCPTGNYKSIECTPKLIKLANKIINLNTWKKL